MVSLKMTFFKNPLTLKKLIIIELYILYIKIRNLHEH